MNRDEATARFTELVRAPERDLASSLDEAALLIAAHANPDLDVEAYRRRLDDMASACTPRTLDGLLHAVYDVEGFRGNTEDYYDPRNSYLDQVLDRRLGIPISLAVVVMEVGRRLGLPLVGIGMPGHFLVRLEADPPALIDPFDAGKRLTLADCEARFNAAQGDDARFDPSLLVPVGRRAILARMLGNLKQVHENTGDGRALEWVIRLRTAIPGVPARERLELANVLSALGRFDQAATTLEELAELASEQGATKLRRKAKLLRARLN